MNGQKHGKSLSNGIKLASVSTVLTLLLVQSALAYLDPGSGAIAVQMLMAAIATGVGYVIMFYQQIKVKVHKLKVRFFGGQPVPEPQVDEEKVESNADAK